MEYLKLKTMKAPHDKVVGKSKVVPREKCLSLMYNYSYKRKIEGKKLNFQVTWVVKEL